MLMCNLSISWHADVSIPFWLTFYQHQSCSLNFTLTIKICAFLSAAAVPYFILINLSQWRSIIVVNFWDQIQRYQPRDNFVFTKGIYVRGFNQRLLFFYRCCIYLSGYNLLTRFILLLSGEEDHFLVIGKYIYKELSHERHEIYGEFRNRKNQKLESRCFDLISFI